MSYVVALMGRFREQRMMLQRLLALHKAWRAFPSTPWRANRQPVAQKQRRLQPSEQAEAVAAF